MSPQRHTLEWYRADQTPRILRTSARGGGLVLLGVLLTGVALGGVVPSGAAAWSLGAVGATATLAGPLYTLGAFQKLMTHDVYVAVTGEGVCVNQGLRQLRVAWDDLREVRWEPRPPGLVLEHPDGTERLVHRFYGISGPDLAARLNHFKRRALHNLPVA